MVGGKKFKVAAFIANYCSTFSAVITVYLLYSFSSMRSVIERRFPPSRRDAFFTLLIVSLLINVCRAVLTHFIYSDAKNPDRAQKSFYRGAAAAVLSAVWTVILLIQLVSKNWLITFDGTDVFFFLTSLVELAAYPMILYCTYKNSKQVYMPDTLSATEGNPKQMLPPIKLPVHNGFAQQQNFDDNDNSKS